ncbi:hypothetical protein E0L36_22015 [Streptomyces sp. AJS327]|uniref:hypothetical protein n=1 Tax=Streptomyces sp. AJS327 TaxID=2545265 RepID=UPI0015DDD79D|nr:hypothetical protein [Streptomyces sp. AJS327]MBA0053453.1 hypothetical protein [Streptomyces sp. AJS327]
MHNEPEAKSYPLPEGPDMGQAVDSALKASQAAAQRLGRVMCVITAAAVRDVLTDRDHDAPFDAEWVEVAVSGDGSLFATGWYWPVSGERTAFADVVDDAANEVFDMNEWTPYLDDSNREVWEPISERLPDHRDGRRVWRINLAAAAALPLA